MAHSVNSAIPEMLYRYASYGIQIDHDLTSKGESLVRILSHFEQRCKESAFRVTASALGGNLKSYGSQNTPVDELVQRVGQQFALADGMRIGLNATASWVNNIKQWWANTPSVVKTAIQLLPILVVPVWLITKIQELPWIKDTPASTDTALLGRLMQGDSKATSSGEEGVLASTDTDTTLGRLMQEESRVAASGSTSNYTQQITSQKQLDAENFSFTTLPVAMEKVRFINWYGNTEFAYKNRKGLYKELQGLHSGLDFAVPSGTPITNAVNRPGVIRAINGKPYNYGANNPGSILVDYGKFLILYGHTSRTERELGNEVKPGDLIGYTGDDGNLEHLHIEVIKKNDADTERLGNIRTNPVPYFPTEINQQLEAKAWDSFHPTTDNRWQTPSDQPDINPGDGFLVS